MHIRRCLYCIGMVWILFCLIGCDASCAPPWLVRLFIPKSEPIAGTLMQQIQKGFEQGKKSFSHQDLNDVLQRVVDAQTGYVAYAQLRNNKKFVRYIKALHHVRLSTLSKKEQLALFINAYNAFTLQLITQHLATIRSIRDIRKPWTKKRFILAKQRISLHDIEHRILRPLFQDARIHFAINCASIGCPPLAPFAFSGKQIDAQLESICQSTLQKDRYVNLKGKILHLSPIFAWYRMDFKTKKIRDAKKGIIDFVRRYAEPKVRTFLHSSLDISVQYNRYNWKLNIQPNQATK